MKGMGRKAKRFYIIVMVVALFCTNVLTGWAVPAMEVRAEASDTREYQVDYSTMVWSEASKKEPNWQDGEYGQYYLRTTADDSDTRYVYLKWDLSQIQLAEGETARVRLSHNAGNAGAVTRIGVYPAFEAAASVSENASVSNNGAAAPAADGFMTWDGRHVWDADNKITEFTLSTDEIPSGGVAEVSFDVTDYVKKLQREGRQELYVMLRSETADPSIFHSVRSARPANPVETRPALIIERAKIQEPDIVYESQALQADESTMAWSTAGNETVNWKDGHYGQLYLSNQPGGADTRLIYLKWDLEGVQVAPDALIKMRLYHNAGIAGKASVVNVYPVTEDWTASGDDALTWMNRAAYDETGLITSFELKADDIPSGGMLPVEVDLGEYVRELLRKGITTLNIMLRLAGESADWQSLRSARAANPDYTRPTLLIEVDDKAPVFESVEISEDFKTVSLVFDEELAACNPDGLKEAVRLAADGSAFQGLQAEDQVGIAGNKLVIGLSDPLAGEENKIKVAAGALKDVKGNVLNKEVVTVMLAGQEDSSQPRLRSAYITGMADEIVLVFHKMIAWNQGAGQEGIQLSVNGGKDFSPLSEGCTAAIHDKELRIGVTDILTEGKICVKIAENVIASKAGNIAISGELVSPVMDTAPVMEEPRIIKAAEDAYVDSAAPDSNYGFLSELFTRETAEHKQRSFMKFDLSGLGTFNTAALKIFVRDGSQKGGTIGLYKVEDDSWSEGGITYSNKPDYGGLLSRTAIGNNFTDTWIRIDISEYLSDEMGKDGILCVMLMDDEESSRFSRKYYSKNITVSSSYPQIEVGYDSQCPQIATTVVSGMNRKIEAVFDEEIFSSQPDMESLREKIEISTDGSSFVPLEEGGQVTAGGQILTIHLNNRLEASQLTLRILPQAIEDRFGNSNTDYLVSRTMAMDGTTPVLNKNAVLGRDGKLVTVYASETVINNLADVSALKGAVSWAPDGVNYRALLPEETVKLSGNTVEILLAEAAAGSKNVLKIAAGTLRDESGNVVSEEYISNPITEDNTPPRLEAAYFTGLNREMVLAFDEGIFAAGDEEGLRGSLQVSVNGGAFEEVSEECLLYIGVDYIHIVAQEGWPLGNYRVRIAEGALRDANQNVAAAVETDGFTASETSYPYAHPGEKDLQEALSAVKGIRFSNKDSAAGDGNETKAAKGYSVIAQAIAAGNRQEAVLAAFTDTTRAMMTDPAKMPNLSGGLDDRCQSPIVYGLSLVWHQDDIMGLFTAKERSRLETFMEAALIVQIKGLNNRQYRDGKLTDIGGERRPDMHGDANNGTGGNIGEPHVTVLLAASMALGMHRVKDIIAGYDHMAFVRELEEQGLTTVANSFKAVNNYSAAADAETSLQEKAKIVNMVVKDPEWNFYGFTLDEYLEDPLKFFAAYDAHLYPHIAQDGEYMGMPGMELEFRTSDSGGPRENEGYVLLGLEPSVANYVLLKNYGYADAPQNAELSSQIVRLQKVGASDWYYKVLNGYYTQCWIETGTKYFEGNTWKYLTELLFSTGLIEPAAFNDTFNYSSNQQMSEEGWVTSGNWKTVNNTIIPYNYKTYVNHGVVGGQAFDPAEKVLRAEADGTAAAAWQTDRVYTGVNYTAWVSVPEKKDGAAGLLLRVQDDNNYYKIAYTRNKIGIYKVENGVQAAIAEKDYELPAKARDYIFSSTPYWGWNEIIVDKKAHRLRVEAAGSRIDVFVDGTKILSGTDNTFAGGYIGLYAEDTAVEFDALVAVRTTPGVARLESVAIGNEELTLKFSEVEGARRYVVHYGTEPGKLDQRWETYSTAPTITGLTNETAYYFAVACETAQGMGDLSNVMSGIPYAPDAVTPTDITAEAYGSRMRIFFKEDPVNTGYLLKYGRNPGEYTEEIAGITGSGAAVELEAVANPYYMVLIPMNEKGMGAPSEEFTVRMDSEYLLVVKVKGAGIPDGNYGPENTIDDNLDPESRWSVESIAGGEQVWIDFELEEARNVHSISLAYSGGARRKAYFDVLVSTDGTNYTPVLSDMETGGTTEGLENYAFDRPQTAKYIRINCNGNSASGKGLGWNSIIEMRAYGDVDRTKLDKAMEKAADILADENVTDESKASVEKALEAAGKLPPDAAQKEVNEALMELADVLYAVKRVTEETPGTDPEEGTGPDETPDTDPEEGTGPDETPDTDPEEGTGPDETPDTDPEEGTGTEEMPDTNPEDGTGPDETPVMDSEKGPDGMSDAAPGDPAEENNPVHAPDTSDRLGENACIPVILMLCLIMAGLSFLCLKKRNK